MSEVVFFLEEKSAEEFLRGHLPKIMPAGISTRFVTFEGKTDLLNSVGLKLRAWQSPCIGFVILVDKDQGDCVALKKRLIDICAKAGKPDTLIRIVCHHLESWYLGDLKTVAKTFNITTGLQQRKQKYRNPDLLAYASEELKKLTKSRYQKISGSRRLGQSFPAEWRDNVSHSYKVFVEGLNQLIERQIT